MTKTKKEAEAKKLEIEEIDRQINVHQEIIRENLKENKEHREAIEELKSRKRKLKSPRKQLISMNENIPMIKLIHLSQLDRLKEMLSVWKDYSEEEIIANKTTYFYFNTTNRNRIIVALKKALYNDIPVFCVSKEQVYSYLSRHSNLGTASAIKKAVQRCQY